MSGSGAWIASLLLLGALACARPAALLTGSGTSTSGNTGGTTSSSSGVTTGGTTATTFGNPVALLDAGTGEAFGWLAVAYGGGETELFFAVALDAGSSFRLQHLAPAGTVLGSAFEIGTGTPQTPPVVSVANDGNGIVLCWDDYSVKPWVGLWCPAGGETGTAVTCTLLPVGATSAEELSHSGYSTGQGRDGGLVFCHSHDPVVVGAMDGGNLWFLSSSASMPSGTDGTLMAVLPIDFATGTLGIGTEGIGPFGSSTNLASTAFGADTLAVGISADDKSLGYVYNHHYSGPDYWCVESAVFPTLTASSALGVASAVSTLGIGAVRGHQVMATSVSVDAGPFFTCALPPQTSVPSDALISSDTEQPLGPVAAAACLSGFGYAYAVDGGNVMFRQTSFDGTLSNTASTLIANLGTNAQSIALVATDGGLLLAVGTPSEIGVYAVTCP